MPTRHTYCWLVVAMLHLFVTPFSGPLRLAQLTWSKCFFEIPTEHVKHAVIRAWQSRLSLGVLQRQLYYSTKGQTQPPTTGLLCSQPFKPDWNKLQFLRYLSVAVGYRQ